MVGVCKQTNLIKAVLAVDYGGVGCNYECGITYLTLKHS